MWLHFTSNGSMPHTYRQASCEDCGKSMANEAALFAHQRRFCKNARRGIREALADARLYWRSKVLKRPRSPALGMSGHAPIPPVNEDCGEPVAGAPETADRPSSERVSHEEVLEQQGLERGRPRRRRFPTPIYRESSSPDRSLSPIPSATMDVEMGDSNENPSSAASPSDLSDRASPELLQPGHPLEPSVWRTPSDSWGLSREFFGRPPPSHDPDATRAEQETLLCEAINTEAPSELNQTSFFPYPNRSSFELGDWWSRQVSKRSMSGFTELLEILRHPDFNRDELAEANWPAIHELLSHGAPTLKDSLPSGPEWVDDTAGDWKATPIALPVPFSTGGRGARVLEFPAGFLHHRSILSVIKERMTNPKEHAYRRIRAHKLVWNVPDTPEGIRTYGELYTSDEFLRVENAVQSLVLPCEADHALERVVVAIMFWTDATLLANFGTAKLWPCYMFFGNDSKYRRAKVSLNLCNHIAYFETLHDDFKDWYRKHSQDKNPSKELVTQCTRELFHLQWKILIDDELLRAMQVGIKILFPDGVLRLVFPRLFTYSADYPEKVLIATVKAGGLCPCPRCMIEQRDLDVFGRREDLSTRLSNVRVDNIVRQDLVRSARNLIYKKGYAIGYKKVEDLLKPASLVPVENAFSVLNPFGFDIFSSLVVDLMHEFELGVWKTLFIHLIRILEAHDRQSRTTTVSELDRRYRLMPAFGPDTIRAFRSNASEQKRLGARDYENLLQCSYVAFDGLLPEPHNRNITALLDCCAEWHALAKLRMHTEETLLLLDAQTAALALQLETFMRNTCEFYDTRETLKEQRARLKRSAKQAAVDRSETTTPVTAQADNPCPPSTPLPAANPVLHNVHLNPPAATSDRSRDAGNDISVDIPQADAISGRYPSQVLSSSPASLHPPQTPALAQTSSSTRRVVSCATGRLKKKLNIATYKYHALADYTGTIRRFGTTDSYSSERGEVEHAIPKSWYLITDKKAFKTQLAKIERRKASHRRIREVVKPLKSYRRRRARTAPPMQEPYAMASSENTSEPMTSFIQSPANLRDPALLDFLPKLQQHLLPRIKQNLLDRMVIGQQSFSLPSNSGDWSFVVFKGHRLYTHQTIRIRYTTYDLRREEDLLRLHSPKANIMIVNPAYASRSSDESSATVPMFRYARILGIYHANVIYVGPGNTDLAPQRLDFLWVRWYHVISKADSTTNNDFLTFLNPSDPDAFGFLDPATVCRGCHIIPHFAGGKVSDEEGKSHLARDYEDYRSYIANRHADRDMCMRYHWGLGIGHTYSHASRVRRFTPEIQPAENRAMEPHSERRQRQSTVNTTVDADPEGEANDVTLLGTDDALRRESDEEHSDGENDRESDHCVPVLGPDDMVYRESDDKYTDGDDDEIMNQGDFDISSDSDDLHE